MDWSDYHFGHRVSFLATVVVQSPGWAFLSIFITEKDSFVSFHSVILILTCHVCLLEIVMLSPGV